MPLPSEVESLRVGTPPYSEFDLAWEIPRGRPPGTVLVVGLSLRALAENPDGSLGELLALRTDVLDATVVGFGDHDPGPLVMALLTRLAPIGIRAIVSSGFDAFTLRRAFGRRGLVEAELTGWLRARCGGMAPLVPVIAPILGRMLAGRSIGEPERSALEEALEPPLPSPHKWVMLAKVFPPLFRLQVEPGLSVMSAAEEANYYDASGFNRACDTLFGLTPGEIRERLGWEWLLERYLERKGR